ncbi:MAG: arginine--tRNA ligase [SAR324 cluster bacterium]|uniref:Arginine--tRNA ligase n=1 Tax=SAR324 cluster bacterium TaxID=2024889 RepID=A0A2A4T1X4_9DELT|nr:MAG: arginine--tRNA ligase [SAR324 cluster bacterium]
MPLLNLINQYKTLVRNRVVELLAAEFQLNDVDVSQFKFEVPPDEKMGHLAFACFPLAKVARKAPVMIAKTLADHWGGDDKFAKIEAVGPYLNFHFSPAFLAKELISECIENDTYGDNDSGAGKICLLEYSSPNTNKPLHLGHCRNNLLGMVNARLLEHAGFRVEKANLVNDRGIHICKSMLAYQKWGQGETPESTGLKGDKLVGNYYVLYAQKEKEQPELLEEAQQMLRDWEKGDPEIRELWQKMNGWVLDGFKTTYERMGISFDKYYFESETYLGGRDIILDALEKGICYQEENGAVAINLEAEKLSNKILLRGDGTSMYITQDINTTVTKFKDHNNELDHCLFVVGNEQDNHFRVLFTILKKFGYDWADRCEHISYGMITLPEGKMKSREGTVVDLDDLLSEMKAMALQEFKQRKQEDSEDSQEEAAEAIGQAAIKFFILKTNALKEILFNPKESLSFDGTTGPYLQYTHARMCSLLRKGKADLSDTSWEQHAWNQEESSLLVQLGRYPDAIQLSGSDRNPAVLCSYIYDLCRLYNKFYYEHPILKVATDQEKQARLCLTEAVRRVLSKSLGILGITALERM